MIYKIYKLIQRYKDGFRTKIYSHLFNCSFLFVGKNCTLTFSNSTATVGSNVVVHSYSRIVAIETYAGVPYTPLIEIGDGVDFGWMTHISCVKHIKIGAGCLFGSKVYVGDNSHGTTDIKAKEYLEIPPAKRMLSGIDEIIIGDNCWIGDNAVVLAGAHIGKGAIVAANSVVKKGYYPDYVVIAGNPAKVVKRMVLCNTCKTGDCTRSDK